MAPIDTPTAAQDIVKRAQTLIDQAQAQLAEGEKRLRDLGLDPAKVRSQAEAGMGARQWEEAQAAFQQDMADIEQEVQEAKARVAFSAPTTGMPRRPRSMV